MATCDDIHFSLPDDSWQLVKEQSDSLRRHWQNDHGDRLSLTRLPPFDEQLKQIFSDPVQIPRYYHDGFNRARRGLVECKLCQVDQQRAIYIIAKQSSARQLNSPEPGHNHRHSLTYLGLITVPLPTESYVFSLACSENGITGLREAIVSERLLARGLELSPQMWFDDPFDPDACEPYRRSLSDDARYDCHFPDHPLAKLRQYLHTLIANISLPLEAQTRGLTGRILAQFRRI